MLTARHLSNYIGVKWVSLLDNQLPESKFITVNLMILDDNCQNNRPPRPYISKILFQSWKIPMIKARVSWE